MCRRPWLGALLIVLLGGCSPHPVGPARTFGKYQGKAVTTAESALSSVETVRLAAQLGHRGRAPGPFLSVLVSEQEDALTGTRATFASIQPPGAHADMLRQQLSELLDSSVRHVAAVRIAIRRGQTGRLSTVAGPLRDDGAALSAFVRDHGR